MPADDERMRQNEWRRKRNEDEGERRPQTFEVTFSARRMRVGRFFFFGCLRESPSPFSPFSVPPVKTTLFAERQVQHAKRDRETERERMLGPLETRTHPQARSGI